MVKPKTYFELVPVEVVKAIEGSEFRSIATDVFCVICDSPVELERCKIDEGGDAVHEKCYFSKVSGKTHIQLTGRSVKKRKN